MNRISPVSVTRTTGNNEASSPSQPSNFSATLLTDSDASNWSDGATALTPNNAANGSAALTVADSMTFVETESLQAPAVCPARVAFVPIISTTAFMLAGGVMICAGALTDPANSNNSPYSGLILGGTALATYGALIGYLSATIACSLGRDSNVTEQTSPV